MCKQENTIHKKTIHILYNNTNSVLTNKSFIQIFAFDFVG